MRWRKGEGGSNSLSVSGLETKRTNLRNMPPLLYRSLKARLRYFPLKLVTITNELGKIKKAIRLCRDGLVTLAQSR